MTNFKQERLKEFCTNFCPTYPSGKCYAEEEYTEIKAFLSQTIDMVEEKALDKAHMDSPNGIIQWRNYGKKSGYWKYFLEIAQEDLKKKLKESEHYCAFNDGEQKCKCWYEAIYKLNEIL